MVSTPGQKILGLNDYKVLELLTKPTTPRDQSISRNQGICQHNSRRSLEHHLQLEWTAALRPDGIRDPYHRGPTICLMGLNLADESEPQFLHL